MVEVFVEVDTVCTADVGAVLVIFCRQFILLLRMLLLLLAFWEILLITFAGRLLIVIRFLIVPLKLAFEISLVFVNLEEICFVLSPLGFVFLRAVNKK